MLREGTRPDLEPFVAFGPALEMAVLACQRSRQRRGYMVRQSYQAIGLAHDLKLGTDSLESKPLGFHASFRNPTSLEVGPERRSN